MKITWFSCFRKQPIPNCLICINFWFPDSMLKACFRSIFCRRAADPKGATALDTPDVGSLVGSVDDPGTEDPESHTAEGTW
jgi:hypothetical protein